MQNFYAYPVFMLVSLVRINDVVCIIDESMNNADYLRLLRINVGKIPLLRVP